MVCYTRADHSGMDGKSDNPWRGVERKQRQREIADYRDRGNAPDPTKGFSLCPLDPDKRMRLTYPARRIYGTTQTAEPETGHL